MADTIKEPMGQRDDQESGQPVQLDEDKHEPKERDGGAKRGATKKARSPAAE